MGRKFLLDDEAQSTIITAIASAAPLEVCAKYAGVGVSTFWRWMELGKPDEPCIPADNAERLPPCTDGPHPAGECPHLSRYRDFREAVERAQEALHIKLAGEVVKAAPRDWHASAFALKAKWPKTWNVPAITQLTGEGGGPIEVMVTARDRVRARIEDLHERGQLVALPTPAPPQEAADAPEEVPEADAELAEEGRRVRPPRARKRGPIVA
jgi:hypothetical protein